MIVILFLLSLSANVLSAQARLSVACEFRLGVISVLAAGCVSAAGSITPIAGVSSDPASEVLMREPCRRPRGSARTMASVDFLPDSNVQRTGTGRFIVGVIAGAMLVAIPVVHFIKANSSYDSGTNQYSRPAIDIRPKFSRRSAWVTAQLRL